MIKFYKDNPVKNQHLYYNYARLFSFGTNMVGVIGARGIGKTFGAKKYCINKFKKTGKQFCWVRDTLEAIDEICADKGAKFFDKINEHCKINNADIKGNTIYIDGERAGYMMSLSTFYKYKGSDFDIDTVVIDEFIPEKGQIVRGDRRAQVESIIETIMRLNKNYKIIFLANALDRYDPIIKMFDVKLDQGFGIYVNRYKNISVHYADSSDIYKEEHKKSAAGILSSEYGNKSYNENIFIDYNIYFDRLPPKVNVTCIIHTIKDDSFRIAFKDNKCYAFKDINRQHYKKLRYTCNPLAVSKDIPLLPKKVKQTFKELYSSSKILFEDGFIRDMFINEFMS